MRFLHLLARLLTPRRSFAYRTLEADRDFWKDRCDHLSEKVDGLHRLLLHNNGSATVEQLDNPGPATVSVSSGRPSRAQIDQKYQDQFAAERGSPIIKSRSDA